MSHIPDHFTTKAKEKRREAREEKHKELEKKGRWRNKKLLTLHCVCTSKLFFLSIANLKSCILTLGKKASPVFKLYAKICLSVVFNDEQKMTGLHAVQAYFGQAKACLCSCCCSCHLWFYDKGRLGRRPISSSLLEFHVALSRAKIFACPKKTPALQASLHSVWSFQQHFSTKSLEFPLSLDFLKVLYFFPGWFCHCIGLFIPVWWEIHWSKILPVTSWQFANRTVSDTSRQSRHSICQSFFSPVNL